MAQTLPNPANERGRAIVYLRVSTDDQAEHGNGLDAQDHACRAHALRLGLDVVGPFADEGISGAAPLDRRPGLIEATRNLSAGDLLLVAKRDRLGRDPIVVAMIEAGAIRVGARVVSAAGEGTDGDGPTDILMRRIIDAFAEFERLMIRGRTRAALLSLRRRGRVYSPIPFGWKAVDDGSGTKTSKGKRAGKLEPDPDEVLVIAEAVRLRGEGFSFRAIAERLDRLGARTRSGRKWDHSVIRNILRRDSAGTLIEPNGA